MESSDVLSLEQQFKVALFASQVENLSTDEIQELTVELYANSLMQQRLFEKMMGEYLGINHPAIA